MEILHTPWRRAYVLGARDHQGCLFCGLLGDSGPDAGRLIVQRARSSSLMLNAYPYTPGHMMAVPHRHAADLGGLPHEDLLELLELSQWAERLLRRAYGCRSVHIGANLGAAAGAGAPEHIHLHIVARPESPLWERCAESLEAPEALTATWQRLREASRGLSRNASGANAPDELPTPDPREPA
jgi:ATP adenylyltransferase